MANWFLFVDVDKGSGNPFLSNPFRFKRKQEDAHYSQKRFKVDNSGMLIKFRL